MASGCQQQSLVEDEIHRQLFEDSDDEQSCISDTSTERESSSDGSCSEDEEPIYHQVRPSVPSGAASSAGAGPSGLQPQVSSPPTPTLLPLSARARPIIRTPLSRRRARTVPATGESNQHTRRVPADTQPSSSGVVTKIGHLP